jgi:hypothetical protein
MAIIPTGAKVATASVGQRAQDLTSLGHELGCRVLVARGERMLGRSLAPADIAAASEHLHAAVSEFTSLDMPFEAARSRRLPAETMAPLDPAPAEAEARTALFIPRPLTPRQRVGRAGLDADAAVVTSADLPGQRGG